MPFVEVEGARVSYRVDGQGPALVLVHGTGGDACSNWDAMTSELTKNWMVIRPDYSGSGMTEDSGAPLSIAILAHQIVAAANAAGAKSFSIIGFSLGAAIAIAATTEYKERIRSLVLLNGFAHAGDARSQLEFRFWRDLIDRDRDALARLILLTGFTPEWFDTLSVEDVDAIVSRMVSDTNWSGMRRQIDVDLLVDVRREAAGLSCPTLVIGSIYDHMVSAAHGRELTRLIPGAQHVEISSGHLAPMEHPSRVLDAIEPFLRATPTS
ncbi:alpha/beta fold hydrolase [Asaia sp. As-1742]|uniref:alpha/beta fold hydrolase n=1 Tax=Asaia sp. As-1742 TaxID=2608325 RepID=UPI0014232D75|nr:alpha/beta fold hydrolase [Asaia sp. As-1742]NIE79198.1 alpha/beta fold hydrolase [Asaia sp. As-1742]